MNKPKIGKLGEIFFEYLIPESTKKYSFVILCEGMPSKPSREKLMNKMMTLGYGVLYPRYKGTWESEGEFLKENPGKDISYLVQKISNGTVIGNSKLISRDIILIGTSFGASVALSVANDKNIKKIIALSPVTNFLKLETLSSLKDFLKTFYPTIYRFKENGWNNLANGKLIPSLDHFEKKNSSKVYLFAGALDKEILKEELIDFSKKKDIALKIYEKLGHLSFSKVEKEVFEDIITCLN